MESKENLLKELYPEDIFHYGDKLTQGEVEVLYEVRQIIEEHIRPVINDHWDKATFPFEEFYKLKDARIMDNPKLFEGREDKNKPSELYNVFLYLELARFDASVATFYTVHGGLGYNTILIGGNDEQIERFGSKIRTFEHQTCFALTEPDHGSDIAGGMATTAKFDGENWVLNGEKRWIGGADTADLIPVFAKDVDDGKIKCFIVEKGAEGYTATPTTHKASLRAIANNDIVLDNVIVPESNRLEHINGFKNVNDILIHTRADVAHIALGVTAGAFVAALKYTNEREQFGKKLSHFQINQEKLARMQANVVASLGVAVRLAELLEDGEYEMVNSALSKMHNSLRMRETVALAREICGGNGITLDTDVARFFADAEAIYTYEGTHEINALLVGRALTGKGAYV